MNTFFIKRWFCGPESHALPATHAVTGSVVCGSVGPGSFLASPQAVSFHKMELKVMVGG